jgi:hypothetical protein
MLRPVIAFLVAPMAVPLLLAAQYFVPGAAGISPWDIFTAVIAYAGAFLVGLPTYLFLKDKKWTAFWMAPIAGFMVAVVTWYVFIAVSPLLFGLFRFVPRMSELAALLYALWPIGPAGAITGALLWLIARPDRSTTAGNTANTANSDKVSNR